MNIYTTETNIFSLQNPILLPTSGGPINEAIPWNSIINPYALVTLSIPMRSVKTTE